jgi:hypothetical protein
VNPAVRNLIVLQPPFTPPKLFRAEDQGLWYDPSDLAAAYQESTSITPAALGSVLGFVGDKRLGMVRGAELVVNGDFGNGLTGWNTVGAGGTFAVVSGALEITGNGVGSNPGKRQSVTGLTVDRCYEVTASASKNTASSNAAITFAGTTVSTASATMAALRFTVFATATSHNLDLVIGGASASGTAQFDNISVREIAGNHAKQATAGSRPALSAGNVINYSSGTKSLVTTFPSALGSSCTVARAVLGVGASILTGQTIGATYTDTTDHCGLVIINRDLTSHETARLTRYLNRKAGV